MVDVPQVTFISGGVWVPSSRFRVQPVAQALANRGWKVTSRMGYGPLDQHLGDGILRRAYRAGCRLRRAAVTATLNPGGPVIVQRLAWPWSGWPESRLARRSGGLVFDFDDAVFLGRNGHLSAARDRALKQVFTAASRVVAGNGWLADYARDYAEVSVIPTCIDTRHYVPNGKEPGEAPVVIGWMGSSSNFRFLEQMVEPLRRLRKSDAPFEFIICSDAEESELFARLGARFVRWSATTELAVLQSFDIGLMPLHNDDWCRGKCSFKLIQYGAVGIASVASAVGFNRDVIDHGETGLLVQQDDWFQALKLLLEDDSMRQRLGRNARDRVEGHFDIGVAVASWESILEELI